jgi:hypothetical protein
MRVFGVPLWPERLSDEEYVNHVRKGLRVIRWSRWLFAGLFIGVVAFCLWAVISFADFLTSFGGKEGPERPLAYGVLGLGILFGGFMGFWIVHLGEVVVNAFLGYRRDKLLVECWDALHQDRAQQNRANEALHSTPR